MSSWLSSNLTGSLSSISNLTGQISSFTREILTEGADEVSGKISWMSSFRVRFACFTVNYSRFKGQAFNFVVLSYISADCQICVNNVRCNKIISCTCAPICKCHMIMTMKLKYRICVTTDPSAELHVAQARINELEAILLTQKAEVRFA